MLRLSSSIARRRIHASSRLGQFFGTKIDLEFVNRDGTKMAVKARSGDSILDTVMDNEIEIDGFGICGGGTVLSR